MSRRIARADPRASAGRFVDQPDDAWILPQCYIDAATGMAADDEQRRHAIEMDELNRAKRQRQTQSALHRRALSSAVIVAQLRRLRANSVLYTQFLLYMPFLVLFLVYYVLGAPTEPSYWLQQQLTGTGMGNQFATASSIWPLAAGEVDNYFTEHTINQLYSVDDVHAWLQSVVAPYLWDVLNPSVPRPVGAMAVGVNLLIGSLRLRTLRARGGTCELNPDTVNIRTALATIPSMRPVESVGAGGCYAAYSASVVNTSRLRAAPGMAYLSAFPYATCDANDALRKDLADYSCSGNVLDIPFSLSYDAALQRINMSRSAVQPGELGLLSETLISTRLFNLQFFSFSPEPKLYMFTEVAVEVSASGALVTSTRSRAFEVHLGDSAYTGSVIYFSFFAAFTVFCFVVFLLDAAWVFRYERFLNLFTLWRLMELANFGVFFTEFAFNVYWVILSASSRQRLSAALPDGNPQSLGNSYPVELEKICLFYTAKGHLNAFNIVVMCLLFIKYASRWSSISRAIAAARGDLIGILVIFALIVVSYAISGMILFGHGMDRYSNMSRAISATMRVLVGDFDYGEMKKVSPVLAGLYFWSYNVLAVFMMLNFFVGALKNAYSRERERLEDSSDPIDQSESPSVLLKEAWKSFVDFVKDFRSSPRRSCALLLLHQRQRFFEQRDMHLLVLAINDLRCDIVMAEHGDKWPYENEPADNLFLPHVDELLGAPLVTKDDILAKAKEVCERPKSAGGFFEDAPGADLDAKLAAASQLLNVLWPKWCFVCDNMPLGDAAIQDLHEAIAATVSDTLDLMFGQDAWPKPRQPAFGGAVHPVPALVSTPVSHVMCAAELFLPVRLLAEDLYRADVELQRLEEALLRNAKAVRHATVRLAAAVGDEAIGSAASTADESESSDDSS